MWNRSINDLSLTGSAACCSSHRAVHLLVHQMIIELGQTATQVDLKKRNIYCIWPMCNHYSNSVFDC